MNWYIGQEIVAIKDHCDGVFKKGDEFVINGLQKSNCFCQRILIDIGLIGPSAYWRCTKCGKHGKYNSLIYWFSENNFAPKQSTYSESEIEAVNVDELTEIINEPEYDE